MATKTVALWICVVVLALAATAFAWSGAYRRIGVLGVRASVVRLGDRDGLLLDGQDHPPWAQSHLVSVDIDNSAGTVTVSEKYRAFVPFGAKVNSTWPVVLDRGRLVLPRYTIQYWDGNQDVALGVLAIQDEGMALQ